LPMLRCVLMARVEHILDATVSFTDIQSMHVNVMFIKRSDATVLVRFTFNHIVYDSLDHVFCWIQIEEIVNYVSTTLRSVDEQLITAAAAAAREAAGGMDFS
jgi:hypothetical protein